VIASTFIGGWRTLVLAFFLVSSSALAVAQEQAADTPSAASGDATSADEENAFTSASFEVTAQDVRVGLVAVRDVGEPRVRTEPGFIRVWFDQMTGWTALDLDGDGGAIRFVRARQGAGDSSVVILRVGDARRVPETAVHVSHQGARVSIAVDRAALPAARVTASAVSATTSAIDARQPQASSEETSALAAAATLTAPQQAHDVLRERALEAEREAQASLALVEGDRTGHLLSLLAITAVLLIALGAVRFWQGRRAAKGLEPSIRIIAATRLSPKQQLVVVRALGQDHLLAIEPGRTERLISITTPTEMPPEEQPVLELRLSREPGASPAASSVSQALSALPLAQAAQATTAPTLWARTIAALGLGPRPQAPPPISPLAQAFAAMTPTSVAPAAGPMSLPPGAITLQAAQAYASTQFGRELARLVESRSEAPLSVASSMPPASGSAVAGLVRLRAQAQAGRA
jgi:flagellar biogenesis protein FliO